MSRAGGRAVDLGGRSVYQGGGGGAKFEIKHKSRSLQKNKLVDWGDQMCRLGARTSLAPARVMDVAQCV